MGKTITINNYLFEQLVYSHHVLAKAEYDRNKSFNSSHLSHRVEDKLIKELGGDKLLKIICRRKTEETNNILNDIVKSIEGE